MKKESGQGLIEYLILVCLIAVSAIAIVTVVGTNIKEQYAKVSAALQGGHGPSFTKASGDDYKRRGFDDYDSASGHGGGGLGGMVRDGLKSGLGGLAGELGL